MGVLGYIAGTLLAPNLAGYLITRKLTKLGEKNLIKEIEKKISKFNRAFDDKEVDSNYFIEFLKQKDINVAIFDRVFNTFNSENDDYTALSVSLANEAIEFVNIRKETHGHPHVKCPKDFEAYFIVVFGILLEIRVSILGLGGQALASTIADSLIISEKNVTQTITEVLGENSLLEEKIEEVVSLIDSGKYREFDETIEEIFDTVTTMSKEQRTKLLFQKARKAINTNDYDRLPSIKKNISRYNSNSRYIDEIDYWLGCHKSDAVKVDLAIDRLRVKGISDEDLNLKKTNFKLMKGNYDYVMQEILNESNVMYSKYTPHASAYFQVGIVYAIKCQFDMAIESFKQALDKEYNIAYEYNYIMTRVALLFSKNDKVDEMMKKEAKQLSIEVEKVRFYIENREKEERLHYWWNYLNLLGIFDYSKVIKKFDEIEIDLLNEDPISIIVSEAFCLNKDFSSALPFLEKIWHLDSLFLLRLLHVYSELDKWERIDEFFKKDISNLLDADGNIFFYKVELLQHQDDLESAVEVIKNEGAMYNTKIWFLKRVLQFSYENELTALHDEFKIRVVENLESIKSETRINLAKVLFNQHEFELVRVVLEPVYNENQEAIEMYIQSFGEINPNGDNFEALRDTVKELYKGGNCSKCILQAKFYIEFFTNRFNDAMESIIEYREKIARDTFYNINLVQNIIFGCLDYDASEEIRYLVNIDVLKYHIMAAQYLGYKGRWHEAKALLSSSFYMYTEQIKEEEISGFLKVYFINMHQDNGKVEYSRACDDSVILLENTNGESKNICIQSNDSVVRRNGEEKLGCINYKSSSDEALVLKATAKKGAEILFDDCKYKVKDIINIHTYHFRCFLNRILVEFPDNKTLIKVTGKSIEELIKNVSDIMATSQKNIMKKLEFYNFEIETGVPITYLSGMDCGKYFETVNYLLNNKDQKFYSSYSTKEVQDSKYVLTISSIFILNNLGVLDKLKSIKDKLCITPSMKLFIRKGLDDSIKYDAVVSTAFLDDNDKFRMVESTEYNKECKRKFWTELLLLVNTLEVIKPESINNILYDKLHELIDISEFEAIGVAKEKACTLVCDDMFITKISESMISPNFSLNAIGLLHNEKLLSFDELLNVVLTASQYKIINCVNHIILFDIYIDLVKNYGTEVFNTNYPIIEEIFDTLFNESTQGFNANLYQKFIEYVYENGKMSAFLYKLLVKPLGFKPYEEFIEDSFRNLRIEFETVD